MAFPLIPESHLTAPPDPERRLRFMEVVRRRMRERLYSPRREFLSRLATTDRVAAATQNQALVALLFVYEGVLSNPLPRVRGSSPPGDRAMSRSCFRRAR